MKNVLTNANRISMYLQQAKNKIATYCNILILVATIYSCKTGRETICIVPPPTEITKPPAIIVKPISIQGIVTDMEGNAMTDVAISFDGVLFATTSSNGAFSYTSEKNIANNYQLLLKKDGYNNAVRTYHYQMGDANYAIKMIVPCTCDSTVIDNFCNCIQPVEFIWTKNAIADNKETLDAIIDCLKSSPLCKITIEYQIAENKGAAPNRIAAFKKYIVSKGITETRIYTKLSNDNSLDNNKVLLYKQ